MKRENSDGEGRGAFPQTLIEKLKQTEGLTLALVIACPLMWLMAGMLWQTPYWPAGLLALPFLAAFHTSLQHETIHGHPTAWPWLNEVLVSLPIALVFPFRRYRDLHLQHHNDMNLTDPYEDPESYFWPSTRYRLMRPFMKKVFAVNNTFAGRIAIGPLLTMIGFGRTEWALLRHNRPGIRHAWLLHFLGAVPVLVIVVAVFSMPVWVYFLAVVYPALSLTAIRSYAEHQAAENIGARSAIVETNRMMALLYLNNNLHIVHHAHPRLPWYEIPRLYRERKPQYLAANEHTLFEGYGDIARRFAFTVKQPVAHPFLHLEVALPATAVAAQTTPTAERTGE